MYTLTHSYTPTRTEKVWDGSSSITLATTSKLWRRYRCHSVCCYRDQRGGGWVPKILQNKTDASVYVWLILTSSSRVSSSSSSSWLWFNLNWILLRTSRSSRTRAPLYLVTHTHTDYCDVLIQPKLNSWAHKKFTETHLLMTLSLSANRLLILVVR